MTATSFADPRAFVAALSQRQTDRAVGFADAMIAARTPLRAQWRAVAQFAASEQEWPTALGAMSLYVADAPNAIDRRIAHAAMAAEAGRIDDALTLANRTLEIDPAHPGARHFLGVTLIDLGRVDAGCDHLRAALKLSPAMGESWLALANASAKADAGRVLCEIDRTGSAMAAAPDLDRSAMAYARGKLLDDLEDYPAAFEAFEEGARLVASTRRYDAERDRSDALQGLAAARRMATATPTTARSKPAPIFVTGKPRSGTTLVGMMVEAHSAVIGGGELNLLPTAVQRARGGAHVRAYYDRLARHRFPDHGRFVDKSLNTSRMLGYLRGHFGDAPVIWIERDPLDTAWSSYRTRFAAGLAWSFDLTAMAQYHALEDRLHAEWRTRLGARLLSIDYATLVDDPTSVNASILRHAGLSQENTANSFHTTSGVVRTASVAQVRKPINRSGLGVSTPYRRWMGDYERAYASARRALGLG